MSNSMLTTIESTVDDYLNDVHYNVDEEYFPSDFALEFVNFIKLVNGVDGEENLTPVLHFKMLDQISGKKKNILNMLFRGSAKTSLFAEYMFLYLGVYGKIPGFGAVPLALYVSDSIENGVKNMRKNLEYRWENSDFLREYIPFTRFTDVRWEFRNKDGNVLVVKGYGAKTGVRGPLALDELVYTDVGKKTIANVKEGDYIFTPYGLTSKVVGKSDVFNDPMYELVFADERKLKVNHNHLNPLYITKDTKRKDVRLREKTLVNITTEELLKTVLKKGTISTFFTKIPEPLQFSEKKLLIEPYLMGLLLGDGYFEPKKNPKIGGLIGDIDFYLTELTTYTVTIGVYPDKRKRIDGSSQEDMKRITIAGLIEAVSVLKLNNTTSIDKSIPEIYQTGSIMQRQRLLAGLLDTDGSCSKESRVTYSTISTQLSEDVAELARGLGYYVSVSITKNRPENRSDIYTLYIRGATNPFMLPRKSARWKKADRFNGYIPLKAVNKIPDEPSQCISIEHDKHQFITTGMLATHNSKEMGKRPALAVLDDLVSDEDARSPTVIASIEDTVYKAIDYALHPTQNKIIWNGTPFNSKDPLYKAVESGAWHTNVFPVCEHFPCEEKDFKGAWEDRFPYSYVKKQYDKALKAGKIDTFNQELMLRIMSDEDRLIQDSEIRWYKHDNVLKNKGMFNFYITTDYATTENTSGDYSVTTVWAYNNNGDWLWVDGIVKRQLMNKNVDDLFRFAQKYLPQQVGVEVTGQQGGFIPWIQGEMMTRNIYFNLASDGNNNKPGIRPTTNKMQRFNVVVPLFTLGKIYFPLELKTDPRIIEWMNELSLASAGGFKSKHDDCIDNASMLPLLKPWKPSFTSPTPEDDDNKLWEEDIDEKTVAMDSYIV